MSGSKEYNVSLWEWGLLNKIIYYFIIPRTWAQNVDRGLETNCKWQLVIAPSCVQQLLQPRTQLWIETVYEKMLQTFLWALTLAFYYFVVLRHQVALCILNLGHGHLYYSFLLLTEIFLRQDFSEMQCVYWEDYYYFFFFLTDEIFKLELSPILKIIINLIEFCIL